MNTCTTLRKNKIVLTKKLYQQNNLLPDLKLLKGGLHRLMTGSSLTTNKRRENIKNIYKMSNILD